MHKDRPMLVLHADGTYIEPERNGEKWFFVLWAGEDGAGGVIRADGEQAGWPTSRAAKSAARRLAQKMLGPDGKYIVRTYRDSYDL